MAKITLPDGIKDPKELAERLKLERRTTIQLSPITQAMVILSGSQQMPVPERSAFYEELILLGLQAKEKQRQATLF